MGPNRPVAVAREYPHGLTNGLGIDVMYLVIGDLARPPSMRFIDCRIHCGSSLIGVHDDLTVHIASRTPDHLDQRGSASQKSLFIGVRIATKETSGRSSPSRRRLVPTSTSKSPKRSAQKRFQFVEWCQYLSAGIALTALAQSNTHWVFGHFLRQRCDQDPITLSTTRPILIIRSSICPFVGLMITSGSTRPVGRTI